MSEHEGAGIGVPPEVAQLLEERTEVQGWLERLRELRGEATPAVYERVRSDYQERLEETHARLADHQGELERSAGARRRAVEELRREREGKAESLEEAELRFRVGEHSQGEWESRRSEGEAALEELDGGLAEEQAALAELERVLGELVSVPRTGESPEATGVAPGEETEVALLKNWSGGRRSGLVTGLEAKTE